MAHCDIGPSFTMDDHDCKPKGFILNPRINIINPMNNIINARNINPKGTDIIDPSQRD